MQQNAQRAKAAGAEVVEGSTEVAGEAAPSEASAMVRDALMTAMTTSVTASMRAFARGAAAQLLPRDRRVADVEAGAS